MPVTVVLAVGLDSWLLATKARVWRSAGYFVVSAESIGEAIDLFNDGDFAGRAWPLHFRRKQGKTDLPDSRIRFTNTRGLHGELFA